MFMESRYLCSDYKYRLFQLRASNETILIINDNEGVLEEEPVEPFDCDVIS